MPSTDVPEKEYACKMIQIQTSTNSKAPIESAHRSVWTQPKRDKLLKMLWKIVPAMRPRVEFARRFTGQLAWSSLDLNKTDVLHSVSFSTSHYVDMVGFEMLTSSASYRIRYTVTQGTGVLGKLVARGRAFVSSSNILSPTKLVKFGKLRRLYPHTLYSIHVLIDIDEFSTSLVTTGGTAGVSLVETGSGVVVHYGNALESCEKTTVHMGQISGIAFWRIDHREEQYLESLTLPAYAGYRETGTMTNPSQDLCFVNTAEDRENLPPMQRGTGVSYCASRILAPCDQIPDPWMNSCTSTSKRVSFVQALPSADLSMSQLPLQGRSSRLNELNSRTTILLKQTAPELSVHTDKLLPIGISQVLDCENQLQQTRVLRSETSSPFQSLANADRLKPLKLASFSQVPNSELEASTDKYPLSLISSHLA